MELQPMILMSVNLLGFFRTSITAKGAENAKCSNNIFATFTFFAV